MARPGVLYSEVAEAAAHIVGQGKNPTIEQVRLFLGTGSSTTLANHLRQWRSQQEGTSLLAAKENIPQELIEMVKGLWDRVMSLSEEKVSQIETEFASTTSELEQELQKYKSNNQRWQQMFNQWQQEKEKLANDKAALEQAVIGLQVDQTTTHARLDTLAQQLTEKQERVSELNRLHKQAQDNLEHYRHSVREQRLLEQHQFEQQKQELTLECKQLTEQMLAAKERANASEQQLQILQQQHATLEKANLKLTDKLEKTQGELSTTIKANNEAEQALKLLQKQTQSLQQNLESATAQAITSQATAQALSSQLDDLKVIYRDLQDQHKLLAHDKWLLAEEKAQMEGRMKQMEKMITA